MESGVSRDIGTLLKPVLASVRLGALRRPRTMPRFEGEAQSSESVSNSTGDVLQLLCLIKLDPFHWMDRWDIPMQHPFRDEFYGALRDAIFIVSKEDKDRVRKRMEQLGIPIPADFDHFIATSLWARLRVRRMIPQPEELLERIRDVISAYQNCKCSKTGQQVGVLNHLLSIFNTLC